MRDGTVLARHYGTGENIQVHWNAGEFTAIEPAEDSQSSMPWIAPSLVDLQINGYGGIDFQHDDLCLNDLLIAARALQAAGCAQFLLTLITDDWTKLVSRLSRIRSLRMESPELQSAIAGWHIEGPFLSSEPGFHGAHSPTHMCDPDPDKIHELRNVTQNDPVLLTVAPERNGTIEGIRLAVSLGMKVSLGHANPPTEVLRNAIAAGATGFTHLGNACPQALDRHDNLLWRVFDTTGLTVGLIPDMIHVSPALFRLIHKVFPSTSIYLTTDAMSAAGAPPGRYTIGSLELEVGEDQIVRQPGKTNFAGSALRPIDGVRRSAQMLNRSIQEVWDLFSTHPAQFMGLQSGISTGLPANFCLFETHDGQITDLKTYTLGALTGQKEDTPADL